MKTALKWILFLLIIFAIGEIFPGLGYYIHRIWKAVVGIVVIVVGVTIWAALTMDEDHTKYKMYPQEPEPEPEPYKTDVEKNYEEWLKHYYNPNNPEGFYKD